MNRDFVPYEEALDIRELGFDEPCIGCYTKLTAEENQGEPVDWLEVSEALIENGKYSYGKLKNYNTDFYKSEGTISAPLYQQAFRWFRDKYGLYPNIMTSIESYLCGYEIWNKNNEQSIDYSDNTDDWNMTYEEAELSCLRKLIEIVKQNIDEKKNYK